MGYMKRMLEETNTFGYRAPVGLDYGGRRMEGSLGRGN
jgi:hypothetical protein